MHFCTVPFFCYTNNYFIPLIEASCNQGFGHINVRIKQGFTR